MDAKKNELLSEYSCLNPGLDFDNEFNSSCCITIDLSQLRRDYKFKGWSFPEFLHDIFRIERFLKKVDYKAFAECLHNIFKKSNFEYAEDFLKKLEITSEGNKDLNIVECMTKVAESFPQVTK